MSYDYGECEICDTPMVERHITQAFSIKGRMVVIEDIPAGVCPQCGEKVVQADIGRWVAEIVSNPEKLSQAPTIPVPVFRYAAMETAG
jgi:YgiT-type zinc finger domain-containing protein